MPISGTGAVRSASSCHREVGASQHLRLAARPRSRQRRGRPDGNSRAQRCPNSPVDHRFHTIVLEPWQPHVHPSTPNLPYIIRSRPQDLWAQYSLLRTGQVERAFSSNVFQQKSLALWRTFLEVQIQRNVPAVPGYDVGPVL